MRCIVDAASRLIKLTLCWPSLTPCVYSSGGRGTRPHLVLHRMSYVVSCLSWWWARHELLKMTLETLEISKSIMGLECSIIRSWALVSLQTFWMTALTPWRWYRPGRKSKYLSVLYHTCSDCQNKVGISLFGETIKLQCVPKFVRKVTPHFSQLYADES